MSIWIIGEGGGGGGASPITILMIYLNGMGPKCEPDVTLKFSTWIIFLSRIFQNDLILKVKLKYKLLNVYGGNYLDTKNIMVGEHSEKHNLQSYTSTRLKFWQYLLDPHSHLAATLTPKSRGGGAT